MTRRRWRASRVLAFLIRRDEKTEWTIEMGPHIERTAILLAAFISAGLVRAWGRRLDPRTGKPINHMLEQIPGDIFRISDFTLIVGIDGRLATAPARNLFRYEGPRWQDIEFDEEEIKALLVIVRPAREVGALCVRDIRAEIAPAVWTALPMSPGVMQGIEGGILERRAEEAASASSEVPAPPPEAREEAATELNDAEPSAPAPPEPVAAGPPAADPVVSDAPPERPKPAKRKGGNRRSLVWDEAILPCLAAKVRQQDGPFVDEQSAIVAARSCLADDPKKRELSNDALLDGMKKWCRPEWIAKS
jgi:hypothetical protein